MCSGLKGEVEFVCPIGSTAMESIWIKWNPFYLKKNCKKPFKVGFQKEEDDSLAFFFYHLSVAFSDGFFCSLVYSVLLFEKSNYKA